MKNIMKILSLVSDRVILAACALASATRLPHSGRTRRLAKRNRQITSLIVLSGLSIMAGITSSHGQLWVARYNYPFGSMDYVVDVAADINGNVIVAGTNRAFWDTSDMDFITAKYNSMGELQWMRRYDGPAGGPDVVNGLAVDLSGAVIITGSSWGGSTGCDSATLKYASDGTLLWAFRYNNGNSWDKAVGVKVGADGSVVVAGSTHTEHTTSVFKLDSQGNEVWRVDYTYPLAYKTLPAALAMDDACGIFVAGYAEFDLSPNTAFVAKFNSDGTSAWETEVTAVDSVHTLLVTTGGEAQVVGQAIAGAEPADIAAMKFDASGSPQWSAVYDYGSWDRVGAATLDSSGNLYITGDSNILVDGYTDHVATVLKYSPSGNLVWAQSFTFTSGGSDKDSGRAVIADSAGNVYVAGLAGVMYSERLIFKCNASGTLQWSDHSASGTAAAIALDPAENVVTAGTVKTTMAYDDIVTAKYTPGGTETWATDLDGPSLDKATGIAVDACGNSYVVGTAQGGMKFVVRAYDPSGNALWTDTGKGTANAVVFDKQMGNIYVAGSNHMEYMTRAYDPAGSLLWEATYTGSVEFPSEAFALTLDASGNVVVTGWSARFCMRTYWDFATVKYSSAGTKLWAAVYAGPIYGSRPSGIISDGAGNIFVAGVMVTQSGGPMGPQNADYLTLKYSPSGVLQWAKTYDNTGDDVAYALALDHSGNVFVTGSSQGNGTFTDYATIKYDPTGNQLWVKRFDSGGYDEAAAIVADASGCVLVTGNAGTPYQDYTTIKYDGSGNELWTAAYDGTASKWDGATAIAIDVWGDVYVTGKSWGPSEFYDYATVKYSSATGSQLWVSRYDGPASRADKATALGMDALGNVYVTGESDGGDTGYDIATLKATAISPQQAIGAIVSHVEFLVASGVLNKGQGNSLVVKLRSAIEKLDSKNTTAAKNKLHAFIEAVNDFLADGILSDAQASQLVAAAMGIFQVI